MMEDHIAPAASHATACPVCQSADLHFVLKTEDYTVTHEKFEVWECSRCSLRFTMDAPDDASIARYYQSENYISHSNTNQGLVNRLYHLVRKKTLHSKYQLLTHATGKKTGNHLDIGAGTGAFVRYMREHGWQSTGLEPDEAARQQALQCNQANLIEAAALYQLPADHFDAITLWHVLEHVHDLYPYLQQIKKIVKPGGRIFIALPNYTSYDGTTYGAHWAAYDVPRHLYHFSPAAVAYMLKAADLQLVDSKPMWFDSFYISLLSEKYLTGHARLIPGFMTGLFSNVKTVVDTDKCSSLIYVVGK